jgi:hypothetical protein
MSARISKRTLKRWAREAVSNPPTDDDLSESLWLDDAPEYRPQPGRVNNDASRGYYDGCTSDERRR